MPHHTTRAPRRPRDDDIRTGSRARRANDQIVFGPVIGALPSLEAGVLVKISVEGWALRDPVKVIYNAERIKRSEQRAVLLAIERGRARMETRISQRRSC